MKEKQLSARFQELQLERDELYNNYEETVQRVQRSTELKNLLLEKNLGELEKILQTKLGQFDTVRQCLLYFPSRATECHLLGTEFDVLLSNFHPLEYVVAPLHFSGCRGGATGPRSGVNARRTTQRCPGRSKPAGGGFAIQHPPCHKSARRHDENTFRKIRRVWYSFRQIDWALASAPPPRRRPNYQCTCWPGGHALDVYRYRHRVFYNQAKVFRSALCSDTRVRASVPWSRVRKEKSKEEQRKKKQVLGTSRSACYPGHSHSHCHSHSHSHGHNYTPPNIAIPRTTTTTTNTTYYFRTM